MARLVDSRQAATAQEHGGQTEGHGGQGVGRSGGGAAPATLTAHLLEQGARGRHGRFRLADFPLRSVLHVEIPDGSGHASPHLCMMPSVTTHVGKCQHRRPLRTEHAHA